MSNFLPLAVYLSVNHFSVFGSNLPKIGLRIFYRYRTQAQEYAGNGRCLPAGPLREPLDRLSAIDFLVVNGGEVSALAPDINTALGNDDQCFQMSLKVDELVSLVSGSENRVINDLSPDRQGQPVDQQVYGVAGIGNHLGSQQVIQEQVGGLGMGCITGNIEVVEPEHGAFGGG